MYHSILPSLTSTPLVYSSPFCMLRTITLLFLSLPPSVKCNATRVLQPDRPTRGTYSVGNLLTFDARPSSQGRTTLWNDHREHNSVTPEETVTIFQFLFVSVISNISFDISILDSPSVRYTHVLLLYIHLLFRCGPLPLYTRSRSGRLCPSVFAFSTLAPRRMYLCSYSQSYPMTKLLTSSV